ncbi:hypothetical protein NSTC731_00483 [Nostoc sp. DSM 114167]
MNGTKLKYSPCSDWFPAWRLGTHSGRLCLLFLDQRQSLSEYIPSLKTGNETRQAFGLFLVPFDLPIFLSFVIFAIGFLNQGKIAQHSVVYRLRYLCEFAANLIDDLWNET